MAAALFSLIIDSSGKSPTRFPLSLVSTEEEARRNAVTSFPKSLASPAALRLILRMLGRFWTKSGVQTPFVVASTLLALVVRTATGRPLNLPKILAILPVAFIAASYHVVRKQRDRIREITKDYSTNEYKAFENLKKNVFYQNPTLLVKAKYSDLGRYFTHISYQPISGYCGYATINTVLCSRAAQLDSNNNPLSLGIVAYPPEPAYISISTMLDLLSRLQSSFPQLGISEIENLTSLDRPSFLSLLRNNLNDPSSRYILCFHRAPLFFCSPPSKATAMAVHWSPLHGYLQDEDVVAVGDVNKDYGTWLARPERIWDACGEGIVEYGGPGGGRMGLIRIGFK